MAKLIYINQSAANAKINGTSLLGNNWNSSSNQYYRSLVFTNDGHLLTHGQDIGSRIPVVSGSNQYGYLLTASSNGDLSWSTVVNSITQGTPATAIPNVNAVSTLVANAIASTGSMVYKGIYQAQTTDTSVKSAGFPIPSGVSSTDYVNSIQLGWTWLVSGVSESNKYFGNVQVQNGDLIIANQNTPGTDVTHYDVISTGTTGTVTSVGITNNGGINVDGSPIIDSGSITLSLKPAGVFSEQNSELGGIKVYSKVTATTISGEYWNLAIHSSSTNPTNLVYAIPKVATYEYLGAVRPWFSHTNAATITDSASQIANSNITIQARSVESTKYYAVEIDSNGRLFVNVPWQNDNTNTWRDIKIYAVNTTNHTQSSSESSLSDVPLKFSSNFSDNGGYIDLVWCDIDSNGAKYYF